MRSVKKPKITYRQVEYINIKDKKLIVEIMIQEFQITHFNDFCAKIMISIQQTTLNIPKPTSEYSEGSFNGIFNKDKYVKRPTYPIVIVTKDKIDHNGRILR